MDQKAENYSEEGDMQMRIIQAGAFVAISSFTTSFAFQSTILQPSICNHYRRPPLTAGSQAEPYGSKMCSEAGILGHKTNHLLKATTAMYLHYLTKLISTGRLVPVSCYLKGLGGASSVMFVCTGCYHSIEYASSAMCQASIAATQ